MLMLPLMLQAASPAAAPWTPRAGQDAATGATSLSAGANSRDGNARLLAGALPNADGVNLRDYRSLVLQQSYQGADIDYAPLGATWFVLSGIRDGVMFYERVSDASSTAGPCSIQRRSGASGTASSSRWRAAIARVRAAAETGEW